MVEKTVLYSLCDVLTHQLQVAKNCLNSVLQSGVIILSLNFLLTAKIHKFSIYAVGSGNTVILNGNKIPAEQERACAFSG